MASPFGSSGTVGQPSWTDTIWRTIPMVYREKDAENGGWFRLFIEAVAESTLFLRERAASLATLRHALSVSTQAPLVFEVTSTNSVTASESETGEAYMELHVAETESLVTVSPGDVLVGIRRAEVRSVNAIGGYLTVGGSETPSSGSITITPPSLLRHLAADLAITLEEYDPQAYQRAAVERAAWLRSQRGSTNSISLRARMSGLRATVKRLYWISKWYYDALPAENTFEIEGEYFTDLDPRLPLFDLVRADVIPVDTLDAETTEEAVTVSSVSSDAGVHTLTLSAPVEMLSGAASWVGIVLKDSDDNEFFVDSYDGATTMILTHLRLTPEAGSWKLLIRPAIAPQNDWRPSHRIRVEVEVRDSALLGESAFFEDLLPRTLAQLQKQLPAHVEIAQYVFTMQSAVAVRVARAIEGTVRSYSRFDEVAADAQPVDTYVEETL